jgi:hypothetical protein
MEDNEFIKEETDEILKELWEIKDQYSLSCKSDFSILVKKIKEDIKNISITCIKNSKKAVS